MAIMPAMDGYRSDHHSVWLAQSIACVGKVSMILTYEYSL